ncbi:MAG: hypothetical protein KI790_15110 [Cyclobacteriaceae bacterium]|nr:hypothetical protein [Cyclobacteriaceae bacterium HetDA_MAG_MS6]
MDTVIELLKILGPALIVLYASYLLVRSFLDRQLSEIRMGIRQKNQEVVLPIRLQAYERVVLLLERISPNNLVTRLNNAAFSAKEFQQVLVSEIREEYNHNLSQQVYMSDEAWTYVSTAVEDAISLINEAGVEMGEKSKSLDLAKRIFELTLQQERNAIQLASSFLKEEIREVY